MKNKNWEIITVRPWRHYESTETYTAAIASIYCSAGQFDTDSYGQIGTVRASLCSGDYDTKKGKWKFGLIYKRDINGKLLTDKRGRNRSLDLLFRYASSRTEIQRIIVEDIGDPKPNPTGKLYPINIQ